MGDGGEEGETEGVLVGTGTVIGVGSSDVGSSGGEGVGDDEALSSWELRGLVNLINIFWVVPVSIPPIFFTKR